MYIVETKIKNNKIQFPRYVFFEVILGKVLFPGIATIASYYLESTGHVSGNHLIFLYICN